MRNKIIRQLFFFIIKLVALPWARASNHFLQLFFSSRKMAFQEFIRKPVKDVRGKEIRLKLNTQNIFEKRPVLKETPLSVPG